MMWYFAAYSCDSSFSHVTRCYVCDVFVATVEGSTNMFHVLSALLCVFDAILFMLCLEVMVASWPTGSPALSLEKERDPICCHHYILQASRDCLCLHPVSQFHPLTHYQPVSFEQEGGCYSSRSAIHSTLGKKKKIAV